MDIRPCGSLALTSRISSDGVCHWEMGWRLQPLQMLGLRLYHIITSQHSSPASVQARVRPPRCRTALRSILAEKNAERQPCVWFNERLFLLSVALSSFESSPSLPHSASASQHRCCRLPPFSRHFSALSYRPPPPSSDQAFWSGIQKSHQHLSSPLYPPPPHTHTRLQCF